MTSASPPLIQARDVERAYASGSEVVFANRAITLDVAHGEYVSLMGPSGSGKSTFFNLVGALDFPTGGSIRLGGRDMSRLASAELAYLRCMNIGYIFQNYNLIEVFSARSNVMLPMRLAGLDPEAALAKAQGLLEQVGIGDRGDHLPAELSGGQQQRVAIARALANDPLLILADEPTANLDSKTGHDIVQLLSTLSRKNGVTVVSATHDHRMLDVSDRVVYLRGGEVEKIVARQDMTINVGSMES